MEIASISFQSYINKFFDISFQNATFILRILIVCAHAQYVYIDSVSRNGVRFHVSKHRFSSISNNFLDTKILKNNLQRPFFKPCLNFRGEKTRENNIEMSPKHTVDFGSFQNKSVI